MKFTLIKNQLYITLAFALLNFSAFSQAPQAFKYQALATYSNGNPIANQLVSFRINLLQGSTSGTSVYTETHAITTNEEGLVNLEIGNGSGGGNMNTVDWANGPYFIKVEMDTTGGSNYILMGTSQLLSVPYALYSNNVRLNKNNENLELYITDNGEIIPIKIITDTLGLPCSGAATVTDYDGNIYNTVQIGNQCWFKENLKTTHYSDGSPLVDGAAIGNISSDYTTKYWFVYNDSLQYKDTYGLLYTCAAAMNGDSSSSSNPSGIQGVCPTGWHLPSQNEYEQLIDYLGSNIAGGRMKEEGISHWVAPNNDATNLSQFTALPSGFRFQYTFNYKGEICVFWNSSAKSLTMSAGDGRASVGNAPKFEGLSIRCIKD
ncbi:MAG: hypothetical protein A2033_07575 [Bacteroidetes bacterium GWA2_31_9]|nr:MAG: hypothetical protein A2033_07575 [Bacteroidetes bacterium GWA2_31_9]